MSEETQPDKEDKPADTEDKKGAAAAAEAEAKAKQRRENPRARCSFRARCITTNKREMPGRVTNISIGGLQIQLPVKLQSKDKLYMEINYYHAGVKHDIKVVGEVVHTHLIAAEQEFDSGLKFATKLQPRDVELIKKYVKDTLTR